MLFALADVQGIFSKVHFEGIAIKSSKMQVIKCLQVFCWLETPYYSTGDKLARCLPALHALTGCDTTSKISMNHAPMKAIHNNLTLILNFTLIQNVCNNSELIQKAENFLVRRLKPTEDLETFDDLHLAAFNSNSLKNGL